MINIKLAVKQLEELFHKKELVLSNVTLKVVDELGWQHGHKAKYQEIIFTDGAKHYSGTVGVFGGVYQSEFLDEDIEADITEVEKVPVTTYKWVVVN